MIRFKEFSNDETKLIKLKDSCSFFSGGTPSSSNKDYYTGNIPFIRSGEIHKNDTELRINEIALSNSSAKMVSKGDLLLALYGATSGEIDISQINGAINQAILCIRPNDKINKYYLKYKLEKEKDNILKTYLQGGQGNLSAEIIKNLSYKFPSINEQTKVSNFLSLLDKKIELQTKKIEDLKLFKKGHNKYIFKNNNQRFTLKDLLIEYNNKTTINNEYEILSSTADGILFQNEYFNKQAASQDTTGYKIIPRGYITYRSMSDTGEFHFNEQNKVDFGIVSPAYPVFKINGNIVNEKYLLYYMNENKDFENQILSTKEGGTRFALSFTKLLSLNVNLPNKEEQNNFSKNIDTINKKIDLEKRKLDKLNNLKKGLMQNIFV